MSTSAPPLPPDDTARAPVVVSPGDDLAHLSLVGDVYTVLLSGADTGGRMCVIDMRVPPGGGPAPHRHNFEETFFVLEGEIQVTVRGQPVTVGTGSLAHVPANAPHSFANVSSAPARLLCTCSPAGLDDFFRAAGLPVAGPDLPAPDLSGDEIHAMKARAAQLAPAYQTELLGH